MTSLSFYFVAVAILALMFWIAPHRVELKLCSNWTLWPVWHTVYSTHGTKRYWLLHLPFVDLWLHFHQEVR